MANTGGDAVNCGSTGALAHRNPLWIALLTGVIGIAGAILGATIQATASTAVQQAEMSEQRTQEARQNRGAIYFKFLNEVETFALATAERGQCLQESHQERMLTYVKFSEDCAMSTADYRRAAKNFQLVRNEVFVYGSDDAQERAEMLDAIFPPYVFYAADGAFPSTPWDLSDVKGWLKEELLNPRYRSFMNLMCEEIPSQPRSDCEAPYVAVEPPGR
jgi:hypothetical protein